MKEAQREIQRQKVAEEERIQRQTVAEEERMQRQKVAEEDRIQRQKVAEEKLRQRNEEIADVRSKIGKRIEPRTDLLRSSLSESINFVSDSRELDLNRLDAVVQNGALVEARITQAESELAALEPDLRRLKTFGVSAEVPRIDSAAFAAFKNHLNRLRRLSTLRNGCAPGIEKTSIPIEVMQSRLYTMLQEDPFLLEFLCGPIVRGARVSYRGPGLFSATYDFTINRMTLTFVQRHVDQNGSLLSKRDEQLTSNTRLILRRISSRSGSEEAFELWQSVNLLNIAAALLSAMGPSLDD
jgi:hypothetical protein